MFVRAPRARARLIPPETWDPLRDLVPFGRGITISRNALSTPESQPRRQRFGLPQFALLGLVVIAAGIFAFVASRHAGTTNSAGSLRPTGIPANVSTTLADLMSLSPVPNQPAPRFTLVDQTGRRISLASLKGQVVVLEFMDPHCTDICPIVSQEFVDAYHDLGKAASRVAFIAVNVNRYHLSVAAVAAFSREHSLDTIPSWRFLTGPLATLRTIWQRYAIEVEARGPNGDVVHSSIVYFIRPNGEERYLASPTDDHTKTGAAFLPSGQLSSWGKGIALVASDLAR